PSRPSPVAPARLLRIRSLAPEKIRAPGDNASPPPAPTTCSIRSPPPNVAAKSPRSARQVPEAFSSPHHSARELRHPPHQRKIPPASQSAISWAEVASAACSAACAFHSARLYRPRSPRARCNNPLRSWQSAPRDPGSRTAEWFPAHSPAQTSASAPSPRTATPESVSTRPYPSPAPPCTYLLPPPPPSRRSTRPTFARFPPASAPPRNAD